MAGAGTGNSHEQGDLREGACAYLPRPRTAQLQPRVTSRQSTTDQPSHPTSWAPHPTWSSSWSYPSIEPDGSQQDGAGCPARRGGYQVSKGAAPGRTRWGCSRAASAPAAAAHSPSPAAWTRAAGSPLTSPLPAGGSCGSLLGRASARRSPPSRTPPSPGT
eukprot:767804-Hanusia_phi.AAC.8